MTLLLAIWACVTAVGAWLLVWRTLVAWFGVLIAAVRLLRIDEPMYDLGDHAFTLMLRCLMAAWAYGAGMVYVWVAGKPFTAGHVGHELIDIMTGMSILIALWVTDRLLQQRVARSAEYAGSHSATATG